MTIGRVINPGHEQSEKVEDCHGEREQSESLTYSAFIKYSDPLHFFQFWDVAA